LCEEDAHFLKSLSGQRSRRSARNRPSRLGRDRRDWLNVATPLFRALGEVVLDALDSLLGETSSTPVKVLESLDMLSLVWNLKGCFPLIFLKSLVQLLVDAATLSVRKLVS
jgi:hypothetical protein